MSPNLILHFGFLKISHVGSLKILRVQLGEFQNGTSLKLKDFSNRVYTLVVGLCIFDFQDLTIGRGQWVHAQLKCTIQKG